MWKNTNIFEYADYAGERKLYADPLVVRRKLLQATGGTLDDQLAKQTSDIVLERERADELLANAVRITFELKPIDGFTGEGVSEAYCLDLLKQFVDYYDSKKNSGVN